MSGLHFILSHKDTCRDASAGVIREISSCLVQAAVEVLEQVTRI